MKYRAGIKADTSDSVRRNIAERINEAREQQGREKTQQRTTPCTAGTFWLAAAHPSKQTRNSTAAARYSVVPTSSGVGFAR